MYSQSTSGSIQPGERLVTTCSGDVLWTWQHSIMGHTTELEEVKYYDFLEAIYLIMVLITDNYKLILVTCCFMSAVA